MICIALGANLPSRFGAPEETLLVAQERLEASGIRILQASSVWLTAPVPVSDQPWYRNAVVAVETTLTPLELLRTLKGIEQQMGRAEDVRNAPRVIDLDILCYDEQVLDEQDCQIPHPRMHERAFVLYPLQEIAPEWRHPALDKDIQMLISELPDGQDIQKLDRDAA